MPVEPEVKTIQASCVASICGTASALAETVAGFSGTHLRQLDVALGAVREAHRIRCKDLQLPNHFRRVRRRQERHLARREPRGKAHREAVAVAAGVEHVRSGPERRAHLRDFAQELPDSQRHPGAVGDDRVGRGMR